MYNTIPANDVKGLGVYYNNNNENEEDRMLRALQFEDIDSVSSSDSVDGFTILFLNKKWLIKVIKYID